jgi:SAM-dependent methyltransferase
MSAVAWHDVECHGYEADLRVWRALAEREAGPVLDVGAGTGRVALDLAARGHDVIALDVDAELLAELERRAGALPVRTVRADAQDFALGPFGLIVVPMQTLQLLGDRPAFWRCARAALAPGGLLAAAIADELVPFEDPDVLPAPDVGEWDGRRFVSQPVAVRVNRAHARIERTRTIDAGPPVDDVIELSLVDPAMLAAEARAAGLRAVPGERIAPTDDHVGSSVVMFR